MISFISKLPLLISSKTVCLFISFLCLIYLQWTVTPIFWILSLRKSKKLEAIKDPLLKISATDLARKLRKREISSEELIRAYIERIQEVNPILNAVVDERFSAAIEEAKGVDKFLRETKLSEEEILRRQPLLGLPLTVKESCKLKGLSHAVGCKSRLGFIAEEDGEALSKLRRAGAIPLLVSNTPEICFGLECDNFITGTTCNPYNTNYTCGGSSGGEAALISSGASVIGLGSDVGGSIRIPCMFNGIFGHKPSAGITPIGGNYPICEDENFYNYLTLGPMARYAEDLKLLMRVLVKDNVDMDEKIEVRNVTVFFMEDMGTTFFTVPVEDEIKFALRKCVEHLRSKNLKIDKNVKFYELARSFEISASTFFSVENKPDLFVNQNNPEERYNFYLESVKYVFSCSTLCHNSLAFYILDKTKCFMSKERDAHYKKMFNEMKTKMIKQLGDYGVLLYPTFHRSAFQHKQSIFNAFGTTYSMVFNVLGFPATHVPLGLNKKGLPIGIQVVAGPRRDALCLAIAEELEKRFGGWISPS